MRRKHPRPLFLLISLYCNLVFGLPNVLDTHVDFNQLVRYVRSVTSFNESKKSAIDNKKYHTENVIIVDMGSTGSRMHAYNIQKPPNQSKHSIQFITEIATSKNTSNPENLKHKHAVADYIESPYTVNEHILPLYNDLAKQLENLEIDIKQTPIYFYATGGMRLHPQAKQEKVHQEIVRIIQATGHNVQISSKTISGELEGIFDWLSVNYKLQTLQNNEPTLGALDMGGASTQVALEYNPKLLNNDTKKNIYELNFNNKKYLIYSKSILGYGLTQTKKNINTYNHKKAVEQCSIANTDSLALPNTDDSRGHDLYPADPKTKFSYNNCSRLIEIYLKNKREHLGIAKAMKSAMRHNMQFVAASGYYYNFNFFNSKLPEDLIKTIPDSCNFHRAEFKSKFPKLTEAELNESCFDATYLKILLNQAYNMPENYHNFIIPKHDIDWTIGAALFFATEQDMSRFE